MVNKTRRPSPRSTSVSRKSNLHTDSELIKEVHHLAQSERSLELELAKEINLLSKEIARMKDMEVIQIFKNKWKFLGLSLLKGIMIGFGSVLGATLFIYIFISLLAQLSVVPVIGDFVQNIIDEVDHTQDVGSTKDLFIEKYGEVNDVNKEVKYQ